eukprot:scaffold1827_cov421-Prasinococcus_capsulatus_cf.AAC.17
MGSLRAFLLLYLLCLVKCTASAFHEERPTRQLLQVPIFKSEKEREEADLGCTNSHTARVRERIQALYSDGVGLDAPGGTGAKPQYRHLSFPVPIPHLFTMSFGSTKRLRALAAQREMMLRMPNSSFIGYTEDSVSKLTHFKEYAFREDKPWEVSLTT